MATTSLLHSFLISVLYFSISVSLSLSLSSNELPNTGYITLPINIDPKTHQYYTSIGIGTPRHNMNFAIDLEGESLWYNCDTHYNSSSYNPVSCDDSQNCPKTSPCIGCNGFPTKPGCTNNTCGLDIVNPFAHSIFSGDLGEDLLYLPGVKMPQKFLSGCTDSDRFTNPILVGLANGTKGVLGLARRTQLAFPIQVSSKYNIPPKFSLCLTSKGIGHVFLGGGPYALNSVPNFTPFNSISDEYYISINSITIDGKVLNFSSTLLSIDEKGNGGTKISTMNPYTVMHHSIYKPFVREFVKNAASRKIKRVKSVTPFEACFDANTIRYSITGPAVPAVNLVLDRQRMINYDISGYNSMIEVKKNVMCLAFVDGGKEAKAGIVIGGYQLENRVLEFDLSTSILRFSSTILFHNASCSDPSSLKF